MKTCWLRREGSTDCILFMAGWGMGPEPFADVDFGQTDVLMTYDYRSVDDSNLTVLPQDGRLHLLAWSMGVWVAAWLARHGPLFSTLRFCTATAVGGTLRPIDDRCGIPTQGLETMLTGFSPAVLEDFYCSMFDSEAATKRFLACRPQRSWQALREELRHLREASQSGEGDLVDIFSRRIVTSRDRIFPVRNQLRAWGKNCCEVRQLPHWPFYDGLS